MHEPPAATADVAVAAGKTSPCRPGREVCGAKRIRSLYLPSPTESPSALSTTTPPKGPTPFSTINGATMRLCRADRPAAPIRHGWKAAPTQMGPERKAGGSVRQGAFGAPLPSPPPKKGLLNCVCSSPEGRASPYTIDAATMRPCRGDPPAPAFQSRSSFR